MPPPAARSAMTVDERHFSVNNRVLVLGFLLLASAVSGAPTTTQPATSPVQKYPKLPPQPFGKGVFAHVRAGGKVRESEQAIRALL